MSSSWSRASRAGSSRAALRSFAGLFVAPAEGARPVPAAVPAAPALAVLCPVGDARAVGVVAASAQARRWRSSSAVAAVWTPGGAELRPDARPLTAGAARRLAGSLSARGLSATACHRAALVALPADPSEAVPAARRAFAAAGDAPAVLVLGGPRDGAFDPLLAEHDVAIVLARDDGPGTLTALAVAGLEALGPRALARPLVLGPAARTLVLSGAGVPAALRRVLAEPAAAPR